jgi:hypothetical protein
LERAARVIVMRVLALVRKKKTKRNKREKGNAKNQQNLNLYCQGKETKKNQKL